MIWWWNVYDMVIKMFMTWWGNVQMINDMVSQGRNIFAKPNPSIHASISTLNHFWSYWSSYSIIINHTHLDNFYIHIHILLAMLILITLIRLLTLHWSSFFHQVCEHYNQPWTDIPERSPRRKPWWSCSWTFLPSCAGQDDCDGNHD